MQRLWKRGARSDTNPWHWTGTCMLPLTAPCTTDLWATLSTHMLPSCPRTHTTLKGAVDPLPCPCTLPMQLSVAAEFFGFDDTQKDVYLGGYVNVAFFAVGAPAALLVGGVKGKADGGIRGGRSRRCFGQGAVVAHC